MRRRHPITVTAVVIAAALTALGAGCGGGPRSPSVASLAPSGTTTTTSTTTQSGSKSAAKPLVAPGGGPRGQFQIAMSVGTVAGAKFSACMRKHGVTNFPDPNGQGVITIH